VSEVGIPAGVIDVEEHGSGEPIVFIHPFATNSRHWRKVVPHLETRFRCILPTLPLGAHTLPVRPDADLSPPGLAAIVVDLLDALGVDRATLAGNDTGGAIAQIVAAQHPERVKDLVLVSCDAYDVFPPRMFAYLKPAAYIPGAMRLLAHTMRIPGALRLPFTFGWVTKHPIDSDVLASYAAPLRDPDILHDVVRDTVKVVKGLGPRHTMAAAERLRSFAGRVLVAWEAEDRFFPRRLAERLAREIPGAQLEFIEGAGTFVPEDQPERLAELIGSFVADQARR
jgi:pimeloyl-ACP methyl ester carboxylesterase